MNRKLSIQVVNSRCLETFRENRMDITVKVLKGEECTLQVRESSTILEVKKEVETRLHIPIAYQKLILLGRALLDENTISSYPNIKDGTKLTLVVKKPDPLRDVIFRCFRKFYSENQSQALTDEFIRDFEKKMKQLSLDDLERIATGQLDKQQQSND